MPTLFAITLFALAVFNLQRSRWFWALAQVTTGVGWLLLHHAGVFEWIASLGDDSLAEIYQFSKAEAAFWLQSLLTTFDWHIDWATLGLACFVAIALAWASQKIGLRLNATARLVSIAALATLTLSLASPLLSLYSNSGKLAAVRANFNTLALPTIANPAQPRLRLVVYIGESTTPMHMGVYGYPRNTTPKLSGLKQTHPNLLLFQRVFATHSHTALSLLEALSFGVGPETDVKGIQQRRRISVVDVLNAYGLKVDLVSNQGMDGAWNMASPIIFGNARNKVFGIHSAGLGNRDAKVARPADHSLLSTQLDKWLHDGQSGFLFLHSYAGHGPYLDHIDSPENYKLNDGFLEGDPRRVVGKRPYAERLVAQVDHYDSAIGYIDFAVSQQIERIQAHPEPAVFVYFSDHGESVFSGYGHDSSRFQLEMAHVPFMLFFNDAAIAARPDLFAKYQAFSANPSPSTLARLATTLLDLAGLKPRLEFEDLGLRYTATIGEATQAAPIMVRTVAGEIQSQTLKPAINSSQKSPSNCYHRANSIGKILRGKLHGDCLEVDVMVSDEGKVELYHPPAANTGLELNTLFALISDWPIKLWLDAKNIDEPARCLALANRLSELRLTEPQTIMVEFPPSASHRLSELGACLEQLRPIGVTASYYIPSSLSEPCSEAIAQGDKGLEAASCRSLKSRLTKVLSSQRFTDLSFSYKSKLAMDSLLPANSTLPLSMWGVPLSEADSESLRSYRFLITPNSDPNTI